MTPTTRKRLHHEREVLGSRWREFHEVCTLCGSQTHTPATCHKVDDSIPSGEPVEHPPVPVRVLPPGFSYLSRRDGPHRPKVVARGQVWASVSGFAYYVDLVRSGHVTLVRYGSGSRERAVLRTRLRVTKLLGDKSWRFVRDGGTTPHVEHEATPKRKKRGRP